MRLFIIFTLLLIISTSSFGQQPDSSKTLTRKDYINLSNSQKVGGFIFLGIGVTTLALISRGNTSFDILPILAIGGTLCTLGSIPFFIASGKNKRKAMQASAYINLEKRSIIQQQNIKFTGYPAISVKINL